jgi:2-methylcitrate dehydratase
MLLPADYDDAAIVHPLTRAIMQKIDFCHGGPEYDANYPDGIPTTVEIDHGRLGQLSSGLVMYPLGHARNTCDELDSVLAHKFRALASLGVGDVDELKRRFSGIAAKTAVEIAAWLDFELK